MRWGYCDHLRTSVTLSPPKPLDKIQPNLVCICSHEWGVQRHFFGGPAPWGLEEGLKGQILNIIKFQLLSQFQRLLNQTFCVYSQMNDIKHIRQDFHSASWVMPQGWDFGYPGGLGDQIFFSEIQLELVCELHEWHMQWHNFWGPHPPRGPWVGAKRSNIIKSQ